METITFNPPPPVWIPTKCGPFDVEESDFLLLPSLGTLVV